MALQTSNNVRKIIAAPVLTTDLTITLVDVLGLPNVSDPADWTILTLVRLSDLQQEIVRVDDITGNVLTVQRGHEGTVPLALSGNDECRNFFTSGMFQETTAVANRLAAETAAGLAEDSADEAELWANEAEDVEVAPGLYSAFHWAEKAQQGLVPPASEVLAGVAELATQGETDDGTDDERIVTPLKLATLIAGLGINNPSRAIYKEIQATTVDAGGTIAGANIRLMNTEEYDPDNLGTLNGGSGKVTLIAGTYYVEGSTVAYNSNGARLSFRETGADVLDGTSGWASSANTANLTVSGVFTSTGVEEYYLLMTVDNGVASNGKGRAGGVAGAPECYATLVFTKLD